MTAGKLATVLTLMVALGATGCSDSGPASYRLQGVVTWKGQPVPNGLIRFEPDSAAGNTGPATVAPIRQGRYATPRGRGVIGGRYRVYISGNDGVPYNIPEEGSVNPDGMPLFAERAEEVELPRGDSERDFPLTPPSPR